MRFLGVHPGPLLYTKVFLRLEPLGLELVAQAARRAGHEARLIDLQVEDPSRLFSPAASLAARCRRVFVQLPRERSGDRRSRQGDEGAAFPRSSICVGGHSASFTAAAIIEHGAGAIDCVLKGEGEAAIPLLLAAIEAGDGIGSVPGAVTAAGEGPPPGFVHSLDELMPARDLLRHRRKYFLGTLDPCASIEFSRGCPWDCSFCSAWTFYGRSYRLVSPERVIEDLIDPRAGGLHRRRRRLCPRAARVGDRRGDRPRRHPQALLPRDARRRAAAQQGGVPPVEAARAEDDVPRPRGDRRGGAAEIPQAGLARPQFRGASNSPARSASTSRST